MKDRNGQEVPFVLGVGLPRTGSASMKFALEKLLAAPCYHMWEICWPDYIESRRNHAIFWNDSMDGKTTAKEKKEFLLSRDYKAAMDLPVIIFWKEIFEQIPDCKVILSIRDPVAWFNSVKYSYNNTNMQQLHFSLTRYAMKITGYYYPLTMAKRASEIVGVGMEAHNYTESEAVAIYNRWIEDVKATVPAERLLIYQLGSGWGPICEFLNIDVPKDEATGELIPYPRVNDLKEINSHIDAYLKFHQRLVYITLAITGLTAMGAGFIGHKFFGLGLPSIFQTKLGFPSLRVASDSFWGLLGLN